MSLSILPTAGPRHPLTGMSAMPANVVKPWTLPKGERATPPAAASSAPVAPSHPELESDGVINLTLWPSVSGHTKIESSVPWAKIPEFLRDAGDKPSKSACPLVKLARFGNLRTAENSLRHDANVTSITGVEGDYDGGEIGPTEAIARLEAHNLRAYVITTWSHTPDKPRWRVLAPLSASVEPKERLRYAEALNGVLGGILASESANLSQSYFIGNPPGVEPEILATFDDPEEGYALDEIAHLDELRVPFKAKLTPHEAVADAPQRAPDAALLAELLEGDNVHANALAIVARLVYRGVSDDLIRVLFKALAQEVGKVRGEQRAKELTGAELERMIAGAKAKGFAPPPAVNIDALLTGKTAPDDHAFASDPGPDWNAAPPKPTKEMFYGMVGDIAREGAKGREVGKASVALAFLSYLSAQIGRDLYIPIGDYRHPLHLFTLHVGRTAMGGKGESVQITRRIDAEIRSHLISVNEQTIDLQLLAQLHAGGLSTREGLTYFVHDGYKIGKEEVPAIDDKRLWVFEPEFQNVLAQGKRDGNTLSSALRDVWDGGCIKPATKSFRIWATEPHIALHGCITPGELHHSLESQEITNGFANRFLICWAERTCLVPVPQPTPEETVSRLAERVREVVSWAVGNYPLDKYTRPMLLTPAAEALWVETYGTLKGRDHTSERITAIMERRAPITRRLAALFAATDRTTQVDVHHLEAALAWSEYHRASVEFIFGADAQEREQASKTTEIRHKIVAYLAGKEDWVLRSEIYAKALAKRVSARDFDHALQGMLADRQIEKASQERGGNAPNIKTLYRLVTR